MTWSYISGVRALRAAGLCSSITEYPFSKRSDACGRHVCGCKDDVAASSCSACATPEAGAERLSTNRANAAMFRMRIVKWFLSTLQQAALVNKRTGCLCERDRAFTTLNRIAGTAGCSIGSKSVPITSTILLPTKTHVPNTSHIYLPYMDLPRQIDFTFVLHAPRGPTSRRIAAQSRLFDSANESRMKCPPVANLP
jgi:hypothetical protein